MSEMIPRERAFIPICGQHEPLGGTARVIDERIDAIGQRGYLTCRAHRVGQQRKINSDHIRPNVRCRGSPNLRFSARNPRPIPAGANDSPTLGGKCCRCRESNPGTGPRYHGNPRRTLTLCCFHD